MLTMQTSVGTSTDGAAVLLVPSTDGAAVPEVCWVYLKKLTASFQVITGCFSVMATLKFSDLFN
jgi:hypothetical protein